MIYTKTNKRDDWQAVLTRKLAERLKKKINGGVYLKITPDDRLRVEITKKEDNVYFIETFGDNISIYAMAGESFDDLVEQVIKRYRRYVLSRFFYL